MHAQHAWEPNPFVPAPRNGLFVFAKFCSGCGSQSTNAAKFRHVCGSTKDVKIALSSHVPIVFPHLLTTYLLYTFPTLNINVPLFPARFFLYFPGRPSRGPVPYLPNNYPITAKCSFSARFQNGLCSGLVRCCAKKAERSEKTCLLCFRVKRIDNPNRDEQKQQWFL